MARAKRPGSAGFTLLEVLIAFAILAVAVVSLIELTSQGLRLLKLSGDHQQAVQIADRIARDTLVYSDEVKSDAAALDTGEEGNFSWERRIERLPLPEELEPRETTPGKEAPGLYAVSVAVRWGRNQSVQVATLRAPSAQAAPTAGGASATDQQSQTSAQGGSTPSGTAAPGGTSTGSTGTRPSGGAGTTTR